MASKTLGNPMCRRGDEMGKEQRLVSEGGRGYEKFKNHEMNRVLGMRQDETVNREKVNSFIPFKMFDEWSNYLIGWRSRVSMTLDRVIGSRQEGGDFRYDEYKKQDVPL
ncbi:hypothetical protein TNCV_2429181 [Trichonephila clavipes]|nr:hypothetical protein TNCV_2429181 [Trichonephila clavipes]